MIIVFAIFLGMLSIAIHAPVSNNYWDFIYVALGVIGMIGMMLSIALDFAMAQFWFTGR